MPPLNRRQFLAGAAAGLASADVAARSVSRFAGGAAERLNVAVMGVHSRGKRLAVNFAQLADAEVAVICDVDRQSRDAAIKATADVQERAPSGESDIRRVLDDPNIDALVIAAPDHWHAPATLMALEAGKHVYVEKPGSHSGAEAEALRRSLAARPLVAQLGTQRRSWPIMRDMADRLRGGAIGPVRHVRAWYANQRKPIGRTQAAPIPDWLDWNLWQGPAPRCEYQTPWVHYEWHWFWRWATGELGNNGVHFLDLARWALDLRLPRRVTSGGSIAYFRDDDRDTPDTQTVVFDHPDCSVTWEHLSWHPRGQDGSRVGVSFQGSDGALVTDGAGFRVYDPAGKLLEEVERETHNGLHQRDFVDAVRNSTAPNSDLRDGLYSAWWCHLGNLAQRAGAVVSVDPQTGSPGELSDHQAWRRTYEPGWEPPHVGAK